MLIGIVFKDDRKHWHTRLYEAKRTSGLISRHELSQVGVSTALAGIAQVDRWSSQERVVLIAPAGKHTERSRGLLWGVQCHGPRGCGVLGKNTNLRDAELRALDHEAVHAITPIRMPLELEVSGL